MAADIDQILAKVTETATKLAALQAAMAALPKSDPALQGKMDAADVSLAKTNAALDALIANVPHATDPVAPPTA